MNEELSKTKQMEEPLLAMREHGALLKEISRSMKIIIVMHPMMKNFQCSVIWVKRLTNKFSSIPDFLIPHGNWVNRFLVNMSILVVKFISNKINVGSKISIQVMLLLEPRHFKDMLEPIAQTSQMIMQKWNVSIAKFNMVFTGIQLKSISTPVIKTMLTLYQLAQTKLNQLVMVLGVTAREKENQKLVNIHLVYALL